MRGLQKLKLHRWEDVGEAGGVHGGRSQRIGPFMQQLWFPTPDNDSESTMIT